METWEAFSQTWMHSCIRSGMYDNALALLKAGLHASNSEVCSVIRSDAALIYAHAVAFETPLENNHMKQIKQIIRVLVQDYGLELKASLWGKLALAKTRPWST